jgi:tetratricopeptide (TPR) repeat protein
MARAARPAYTRRARHKTAPGIFVIYLFAGPAYMSRLWLPRRFPVVSGALLAAVVYASPAVAQDPVNDPRAVSIIGDDPHARRCATVLNSGDVSDQAVQECTSALGYARLSREGHIELQVARGVLYLRRHQNDLALADFDAVIGVDPRNAQALVNRGATLVQLRRYGEAVAALTDALSYGVPQPYKAYYNRGVAREALGDLQGAYDDYSTALQIHPDWSPAEAEVARFVEGRREHLADVLTRPATP